MLKYMKKKMEKILIIIKCVHLIITLKSTEVLVIFYMKNVNCLKKKTFDFYNYTYIYIYI